MKLNCFRVRTSFTGRLSAAMLIVLVAAITAVSCRQPGGQRQQAGQIDEKGGFVMRDASDCLPDITLVDSHGQKISLSELRGKPVLFDFIYTTCPGPCLLLTSRMKQIADQLGPALGTEARIVSITVDPEHDQPQQLLTYAKKFRADMKGWLFLTGTPKQIDDVMARFKLYRQRETNGSVDHVLEFFLVGGNGRALLQYMGEKASPRRVASDLEQAAAGRTVAAGGGSDVPTVF